MGQYDGAVLINTKINTKSAEVQLAELENRMAKTADKIASLRSKMDSLKDAKIPTQEYSEISKQVEKAEQEFNKLLEKQEQMQREGKDHGVVWERLQDKIEQTGNTIKYAQGELQELVDTGKAFTLGSDTEEYSKLSQQLGYAENELSILTQKHDELVRKQQRNTEAYKKLGDIAKKALTSVGNMLKKANSYVNSFAKKLKELAYKHLPFLRQESEKTKSSLAGFVSRLKSLALSLLIFNQIRKLFSSATSAIKTGFENLYNENERFRSSIDNLKASLLTLKNAFTAAFAPIIEAAIPYIQRLVEWVTKAADAVGQLLSALMGRETYTKAVKQSAKAAEDVAEATEEETKTMNKQLSSLDKLNNLTSENNKENEKGTGTDVGSGIMFEEVPISDKWKDIAQWLKDMWKNSDFYDLGKMLGEKLKAALDSIPWDEIKETARKIGKSIASFINGFIEVEGLGYSIGKTLAEAINTAYEFFNAFVHELHWESIGKFIADTLNGFFENIDWELIRDTFVTGFKGLADAINSFIANFHWDNISNTISNMINIVAETVYTFFSTVNWDELGKNLGDQLMKTIKKIDWVEVGRALGSIVQAAIDFLKSFIKELDMSEIAKAFMDVLKGFFETADAGDVALAILAVLGAKLAMAAASYSFHLAGQAISKAITTSLLPAIGSAFAEIGFNLMYLVSTYIGPALAVAAAAVAGWEIGSWIAEKLGYDPQPFNETMKGIKDSFTDGTWKEALQLWGDDIYNAFVLLGERQAEAIEGIKAKMIEFGEYVKNDWNNSYIGQMIESFTDGTWKEALQLWGEDIKESVKSVGEFIKEDWNNSYIGQMINSFKDGSWKEALSLWKKDILDAFDTLGERMTEKWNDACESLKSTAKKAFDWISQKWSSISSGIGSLGGKISGAFKNFSIGSTGIQVPVSPVVAALSNVEIPAYATGQVIPRTMKQHLAILGDNSQETEVVSPLSTIEQAVENAINKIGGLGGGDINLNLTVECEGYQLLNIMQKLDRQFYKQNGRHAFS